MKEESLKKGGDLLIAQQVSCKMFARQNNYQDFCSDNNFKCHFITNALKNLFTTFSFVLLIGVIGGMDRETIPMLPGFVVSLALMGVLYARGKEVQHG